jgi:hypothetical protein
MAAAPPPPPCVHPWNVWATRAEAEASWASTPAAQQAALEADAHACFFDGGASTVARSQAVARRWRWADGLAARQGEATARLADAYRLWRHEDAATASAGGDAVLQPRADDVLRFVRRARRRGALPGWWELDECADDALLGADTAPASAAQLSAARGYDDDDLAALRALASEVYARAPGAPQPAPDDSEAEDALSEDGSLADAEEFFPEEVVTVSRVQRGRGSRQRRRDTLAIALRSLAATEPTADAFRAKGNEWYKAGQYGAALLLYSAALAHARAGESPRHVLLCNRSETYAKLRRWRRALADADAAADAAPGFFKAKLRRATALAGQGRAAVACAALARRIATDLDGHGSLVSVAHTPAEEVHALSLTCELLLLRPRAEHCAAVLRFLAPHFADHAHHLVRACLHFSAACVAAGGAPAALEFHATGGCTAARVLVAAPDGPLHHLSGAVHSLCYDTVDRAAGMPLPLWCTEEALELPMGVFSSGMPACMAAHFLDARALAAALRCRDLQPHMAWHAAMAVRAAMLFSGEGVADGGDVAHALVRAGAMEALIEQLRIASERGRSTTLAATLGALELLTAPNVRAATAPAVDAAVAQGGLLQLAVDAASLHGLRDFGSGADVATLRSVCVAACALLANLLTDADADAGMQGVRHAPQREEHDVVSCIGLANFALEAHGCDVLARSAALDLLAACADAGGVRCGAFIAARGSLAHMRRALRRNVTVAVAAAASGDGRAEKHALQGEMRAMRALQTLASKSRGLGALCTAARAPHAILAAAARTPPLSYDAAEVGSGDATGAKTSYDDLHLCVCAALFTFIPFAAAAISGADWLPAALRHAVSILLARPRAFDVVTAATCIVTSITHEDAAAAHALRAWADAPPPALRARADMSARCWELLGSMASAALQQHAAPAGGAGGAAVARAAALARFGAFDARDSAGDAHEDDGAAYGTGDDVAAADWPRRVMSDPVAAAASEVLRILPPGSPAAGVDAALRRAFGAGDENVDARTLPPARAQGRAARRGAPTAPAAVPAADAAAARAAADAAMAALLAEDDAAKSAAEKA